MPRLPRLATRTGVWLDRQGKYTLTQSRAIFNRYDSSQKFQGRSAFWLVYTEAMKTISWKLNFLRFLWWKIEYLDKNRKFIVSFWFLAAFICNIVMNCFVFQATFSFDSGFKFVLIIYLFTLYFKLTYTVKNITVKII